MQYEYGRLLLSDTQVPRNLSESSRMFKLCADQGHRECEFEYGTSLELGRGVSQNYSQSGEYYLRAGSSGHVEAKGRYADYKYTFSKDHTIASELYREYANSGDLHSQVIMSRDLEDKMSLCIDPSDELFALYHPLRKAMH